MRENDTGPQPQRKRNRQTTSHQENPVFSFRTFSYFLLLFFKKGEKEIPATFKRRWRVDTRGDEGG